MSYSCQKYYFKPSLQRGQIAECANALILAYEETHKVCRPFFKWEITSGDYAKESNSEQFADLYEIASFDQTQLTIRLRDLAGNNVRTVYINGYPGARMWATFGAESASAMDRTIMVVEQHLNLEPALDPLARIAPDPEVKQSPSGTSVEEVSDRVVAECLLPETEAMISGPIPEDKITLKWLFEHIPVTWWKALIAASFTIISFVFFLGKWFGEAF